MTPVVDPHLRPLRGGGRIGRAWVTVALAAALGLGLLAIVTRGMGFTAHRQSSSLEETVMRGARDWATPAALRHAANPVSNTPDVLRAAMDHWADHCASCHGNDGSGQTALGRNLHPRAPDMRTGATQRMSDGALFYVIERGIPFTGMPAWGNNSPEGERQSWELVRFIRHLPDLTAEESAHMESRNPRSPAEEERDRQIDDFLSGPVQSK